MCVEGGEWAGWWGAWRLPPHPTPPGPSHSPPSHTPPAPASQGHHASATPAHTSAPCPTRAPTHAHAPLTRPNRPAPAPHLRQHQLDAAKDDDELLQGDGGAGIEGLVELLQEHGGHKGEVWRWTGGGWRPPQRSGCVPDMCVAAAAAHTAPRAPGAAQHARACRPARRLSMPCARRLACHLGPYLHGDARHDAQRDVVAQRGNLLETDHGHARPLACRGGRAGGRMLLGIASRRSLGPGHQAAAQATVWPCFHWRCQALPRQCPAERRGWSRGRQRRAGRAPTRDGCGDVAVPHVPHTVPLVQ